MLSVTVSNLYIIIMSIPTNVIETIKSKADIVEVIGEYVTLKKEGHNYKGLCPFHSDNTPSLSVKPEKGIYKCFACNASGDVVQFLQAHLGLSFPEAIETLAKKYGVEIPTDSLSSDDLELQKMRESMYIVNEYAQQYFYNNMLNGSEESNHALNYASERWPLDFVKSFGIGYATNDWHSFYDYAKSKGLNEDVLLEVGLITKHTTKGNLYDTYRGRVMIPIRNKQKRIIGFTARLLPKISGTESNLPKYINSPSSLIFEKGSTLFGIDIAMKEATRTNEMNLVEGAPDVMRLQIIGASNTVAPLGSSWTDKQLEVIKHATTNINIIPDSDELKNGNAFGAGFQSAIRTGKMAIALGFNVTIQEISSTKGKNDPDSFISSKEVLDSLNKTDFVLWYAEKLFAAANGNVVKRTKAIHDIIDVVKSAKDNVLAETYVDRLSEIYGHQEMWQSELLSKCPQVLVPSEKMSQEEYVSLFLGSEIKVGKNCYYCLCKDGETDISNFIMIPLYLIRDGATATRVFILRNVMGYEVRIEFSIEEMTVLQKFRNRIEREVNFMWYGTSSKFNKLRGILYSNMEVITRISTLGWQKQGFYAFANGVVHDGRWFPIDEEGIVRLNPSLGSFYLPAFSKMNEDNADKYLFERKFVHHTDSSVRFYAFANLMYDVYGDNAIIGICFIIVCLFRDIIIRHRREFPSLFLFGPKGTGKTAFGELLQSPFVYCGDHPNLRTSTMPSLAIVLSQAENAMMHLDEYKNDIDVEKVELLKGLWDCQGRSKLDLETHKREQSKVLSGVIISGQEKPTVDIALYSRQCVLPFHKDTHSVDEKAKFRLLKDYEHEGTSYIILELLQIRKKFEASYASCYEQAVKDICSAIAYSIDERILHNWSVMLASFMASDGNIKFPFSYEQVFKTVISCVEYQNEECLHSNELSIFWKTADYLKRDNQIFGLCDYRIHEYTSLKVDIKIDGRRQTVTRDFGGSKKILMIPTNSRLFAMYALHLQRTREKVIPENTLKYYIENSPAYIGKMNSVRFASVENVKDWPRQYELKIPNCQPRLSEKPVQAYCLDFDAVEAAYGTNLYSDYMGFDLIHTS